MKFIRLVSRNNIHKFLSFSMIFFKWRQGVDLDYWGCCWTPYAFDRCFRRRCQHSVGESENFHCHNLESWKDIFRCVEGIFPWGVLTFPGWFLIIGGVFQHMISYFHYIYTLLFFHKNDLIRTSRPKFGVRIFQKLRRTRSLSTETF